MRRMLRALGAIVSVLLFLVLATIGGFAFLFGTDTGQRFVQAQATAALTRLLGPSYDASLGVQRFAVRQDGTLAVSWSDVTLHRKDRPESESKVARVSVALRLLPLAGGSLEFGRLEIEGARIDLKAFGETPSQRHDRISAQDTATPIPAPMQGAVRSAVSRVAESTIRTLERQLQALQTYHFDTVSFENIAIEGLPAHSGLPNSIELRRAELHRGIDGSLHLESSVQIGVLPVTVVGDADFDPETSRLEEFSIRSGSVDLARIVPPAAVTDTKDERPFGSDADISFEGGMRRDARTGTAILTTSVRAGAGHVQLGLNRTRLESLRLDLEYREGEDRLRLLPSPVRFDGVSFEAEGLLEPVPADQPDATSRLRFRLGTPEVRSTVGRLSDEDPRTASFWLDGEIDPPNNTATLSSLDLRTGSGRLSGNAVYRGAAPDALTSLRLTGERLEPVSVKAFWPFMISGKARAWVLGHIGDAGSVPSATIALDVRHDRLGKAFQPGESPTEQELQLDVDVTQAEVATAGTIPHLTGADGHVRTRGGTTTIEVARAAINGQPSVKIEPSTVTLSRPADGNHRDLLLGLQLNASGEVPGLLSVANEEPVHALRTLKLDPTLTKGTATAAVSANLRLGEFIAKEDQLLDWSVEADLAAADVGQTIEGRRFSELDGVLRIIPGQASGSLDGAMDGMPAKLEFALPFGAKPIGSRRIDLALDVPSAKVVELVPALSSVISGPIKADVLDEGDGLKAELELTKTSLDLPAIAWKKGVGIPAKLSFALRRSEKTTTLADMRLQGDGFSANGELSLDDGGLRSATLKKVALNPGDDVDVKVTRHSNGFGIEVTGSRFDARPILAEIKAGLGKDADDRIGGGTFDVSADIDRIGGFNSRQIDGFSLNYASAKGRMAALSLGGQAGGGRLSGDLSPREDGRAIRIAADDVGAFLGFTGLYDKMDGGQAVLSLTGKPDAGYRGTLKMTNFTLVNEPRLSRIVGSAPAPGSASLSQAVGQELRTERAFFDQAAANLAYDANGLRVGDGIVRGPIFGSSFSGTVYDSKAQIDIAGSFMPAYGINRIFGAIPVLGQILGNGNEGGLIGITYHLSGAFVSPTLVVNPISAIAPGIFRQIFAYD